MGLVGFEQSFAIFCLVISDFPYVENLFRCERTAPHRSLRLLAVGAFSHSLGDLLRICPVFFILVLPVAVAAAYRYRS